VIIKIDGEDAKIHMIPSQVFLKGFYGWFRSLQGIRTSARSKLYPLDYSIFKHDDYELREKFRIKRFGFFHHFCVLTVYSRYQSLSPTVFSSVSTGTSCAEAFEIESNAALKSAK
jgi:hypothetical protein